MWTPIYRCIFNSYTGNLRVMNLIAIKQSALNDIEQRYAIYYYKKYTRILK
jgi:hypothetical protein